jgi:acyl-CoA dehydrogenase
MQLCRGPGPSIMGNMQPPCPNRYPYFSSEHELLRNQISRFVEQRVKPYADQWEELGCVPREILREMGDLGFLGIRYPAKYGGSELDTLATVVLAEELGRSTYGGFAITVLVHTDMASPHLFHAGSAEQLARYMRISSLGGGSRQSR